MTTVGEGNGTSLQYSCLENPMDGGTWWAAVHGIAKSQTQLSDFTFTFHFHALEKEMATHSSVLAWRIPGTAEPGRLPSMGLHRVGHNWSDLAEAGTAAAAGSKSSLKIAFVVVLTNIIQTIYGYFLIFWHLYNVGLGWFSFHCTENPVSPDSWFLSMGWCLSSCLTMICLGTCTK